MADDTKPTAKEKTPQDEPARPAVEVRRPPEPPAGEDMLAPFSQKEIDHLIDRQNFFDEAIAHAPDGLDSPEFIRHQKEMEDAQAMALKAVKDADREKNQAKRDVLAEKAQVCQTIVDQEWRTLGRLREDYIRRDNQRRAIEEAKYRRELDKYDRRRLAFDAFWKQSHGMSQEQILHFKDDVLLYIGDPQVRRGALSALQQRYHGLKVPQRPPMPLKPPHTAPESEGRDGPTPKQGRGQDPWEDVRPDVKTLHTFYVDTRRFAQQLSDENLAAVFDKVMAELTDMENTDLPHLSSLARMRAYAFEAWARLVKPDYDALKESYEALAKVEERLKELG